MGQLPPRWHVQNLRHRDKLSGLVEQNMTKVETLIKISYVILVVALQSYILTVRVNIYIAGYL